MSRATGALVGATVLAGAVFGRETGAATLAAAIAATGLVGWGILARPRGWSVRIAYGLLAVYLAVWAAFAVGSRRLEVGGEAAAGRLEATALRRVAEALSERLVENRRIVGQVVDRLDEQAARAGPSIGQDPELFLALDRAAPVERSEHVGLEVYDRVGALRAWWGDPRGEPIPADSLPVALERAVVRRPAGYTLAYVAAPWVVGADTFRVVVKDVWAVESPLRRDLPGLDLPVGRLTEREHLEFRVAPAGSRVEGPSQPVVGPRGEIVGRVVPQAFQFDRHLAERRARRDRALALLLLWPLAWVAAAAWHTARAAPGRLLEGRAGPWTTWGLASLGRLAVLAVAWIFLVEARFLARLLPEPWFTPLGFAFAPLGPAGRSPGDFLTSCGILALFCLSSYALLPRRGRRSTFRGVAIGGLAMTAVAWGTARAAGPLLEEALLGLAPAAFFSPTLLFSAELLMVLLGFALLGAVVVFALAAIARVAGMPVGPGWVASVLAVVVLALGVVAWALPEAALRGDRRTLTVAIAVALAAGGWLVRAAGRTGPDGRSTTPRFGLVGVALACLVTLPLASWARVQAAHELLVERALRIGAASSQWLDYTMARTVEFLSREEAVAEAIREGNRDAALSLWSRSPLSGLDFATGLYLFDEEGNLVSEFSLTAEDLVGQARRYLGAVEPAQVAVRGSEGTLAARWAVVPIRDADTTRVGTAVALTTGALELRDQPPGATFVLTDLLAGAGLEPDLPGYTTLGPEEAPPPRTLLTRVEAEGAAEGPRLAMPLGPLLPGARAWAVFLLVGALCGLVLGLLERAGDPRSRARWRDRLAEENPLRSFRVQLLLAFLAVAALPLTLYAVLGYRTTRSELEEATRSAATEALSAANRLLVEGPAIEQGTSRALSARLREISAVLQQDFVLYWRGRTVASSRPEIFASRLFADRMEGTVYAELFAERRPVVFESTSLGDRSFLVAYRPLTGPESAAGYVLATPLLIREDRVRLDLQRLGEGVFLVSAFSIGFLLVVGWGLARYMSRPLSELERGTRQIAAGRLSYRLPAPARRDEFGRLQRAFNAMAGRLDASQRALEREKSRVQAILESVGAGVVALDGRGRVRLVNDRAVDLLGQGPEEVLARRPRELARAGDGVAARFWRAVEEELSGGARGDRDLLVRDGDEERHYHLVTTGLRDRAGQERGLVVAFEDITGNVQSQRVLAWGEMARQVAHEIKNPLTPMKLSLQHLERVVEDRPPRFEETFRENLDLVLAEIDRLERIAASFARFGVPQPGVAEPFDAVAVARDVVGLFAPGDDRIRYAVETTGEPLPILGEAEGFRRVLVNLLQNAREAILAKPTPEGSIVVRLDWTIEPDGARISVLDDGIGLPAEGVERLFEPSFSSKTRGTGLGLAISRRIVEAWGGAIEWERRPEGGTAIHLRLRAPRSGSRA